MLVVDARGRREHFVQGKAIERGLKVSRNTVRKVIRSDATAFNYDRRSQPGPKLGPWANELDRLLAANEAKSKRERPTLQRIFAARAGPRPMDGLDDLHRAFSKGSILHADRGSMFNAD